MKQVQWYVLHTSPRIERDIRQRLDAEPEVWETFLPMQKRQVTLAGKRLTRYTPLIPGYLFVRTHLAFLRKFLPERAPQCYLQLDALRQVSRPMVISDAEMERFKFFTERSDGQLTLLHSPYSQFHNNDRVRILTGPFAGYEGFIREIRRDNKLIFKVGTMAIAVSNILRYDVAIVSHAVRCDEPIRARLLVDHLLGRLQFLGFPDEAAAVLRETLCFLHTSRTPEDWIGELEEKGRTSCLRAFRTMDRSEASYFLTLARYYFGREPQTRLLREIPDCPLRPLLTPTAGHEDLQPLTPLRRIDCSAATGQPSPAEPAAALTVQPLPEGRQARYEALWTARRQTETTDSRPQTDSPSGQSPSLSVVDIPFVCDRTVLLMPRAGWTEAFCPLSCDESRYELDTDSNRTERHRYVAHVGMRKLPDGRFLYFSNWDEFYSHYEVLPGEERERLLAKLDKYGLTAFRHALSSERSGELPVGPLLLGPVPGMDFSGLYQIFSGETLGQVLTSEACHPPYLQTYLQGALTLLTEIMQSPRLRSWHTYLRTVWLRK